MTKRPKPVTLPEEIIQNKIFLIRGEKVMLDRDLAALYGVTTFNLNKAVSRNLDRFPPDFSFRLTREEYQSLRFHFGIFKKGQHAKYLPRVFTENGVAMLSSVLRSKRAVLVNVQIMRVFTQLRRILASHHELRRKIEEEENGFRAGTEMILCLNMSLMSFQVTSSWGGATANYLSALRNPTPCPAHAGYAGNAGPG